MRGEGGGRSEPPGFSAYSRARVFLSDLGLLLRRISLESGFQGCNGRRTVLRLRRVVVGVCSWEVVIGWLKKVRN